MYYNLPKGTKVFFPNTPNNLERLCGNDEGNEDYDSGFGLGVIYEIGGVDERGKCYFFDGHGQRNYAGFAVDGSDGMFAIVA